MIGAGFSTAAWALKVLRLCLGAAVEVEDGEVAAVTLSGGFWLESGVGESMVDVLVVEVDLVRLDKAALVMSSLCL